MTQNSELNDSSNYGLGHVGGARIPEVEKHSYVFILRSFPSLPIFLVLRLGGAGFGLHVHLLPCKHSLHCIITGQLQHRHRNNCQDAFSICVQRDRTPTLLRQHLAMTCSSSLVLSGSWPATMRAGFAARGSPLTSITTSIAFWRKTIFESLSWRLERGSGKTRDEFKDRRGGGRCHYEDTEGPVGAT